MSTKNLSKPIDKGINEDSVLSNSTSNSFTETLIQDLPKMKNIFIISKNLESKIVDILSYLQSDNNLANNKIQILNYLQSLFLKVEFNSEIFIRKFINDKERLNLFKIIIYQFILYTNPGNTKIEEENYRSELHNIFILLLSKITVDRDIYHYILSFLVYFINEKNITNAINKKINSSSNEYIQDEPLIVFKSEHLSRVLELLRIFYKYLRPSNEISNYFFFSGESDSSILIPNKENPKDHNKKLLNLDDTLCFMLFIKVLPSEYIKAVYPKVIFRLLELRFNDKNKKNLNINIDIDNNLTTSYTDKPLYKLSDSETNCIIIKFNNNKKKKVINSEIHAGFNKIELPPIPDESDKEKSGKSKDEIKEVVLFKNFIGICSNIIIYKEKKNEGLPKFLFSSEDNNRHSSKDENNNNQNGQRKSTFSIKSIFPNGIFNEELYSYFSKIQLKDQVEPNILANNMIINMEQKINVNDFKDFFNNNLIAIYMPTRVDIPSQFEERTLLNAPQLILRDSINNLDAEFNIRSPCLNGVHSYSRINDDFGPIGGLNNLIPIIEIMTNNSEILTKENFSLFFTIISNFVFSTLYQNAIMKENYSNFFMNLSYFLEKIPENYFNNQLIENFKLIQAFLNSGDGTDFLELNKQFNNYILINEKILFKFNEEEQKNMINAFCFSAGSKDIDVDIIKIIKIILHYDRKKNYKFCCKNHADYFNDNYPIMDSELSNRIQPIEKLIEILFDKKYKNYQEIKNKNNNNISDTNNRSHSTKNLSVLDVNYQNNNLYYFFYLLTFDISPCIQKSIICLLINLIKSFTYSDFVKLFDKKEELFDIVLYVFKTSIFDVKINALNLLFLIEQNNKGKNLNINDKRIFFKNEILPIFLFEEINNLPSIKEENTINNEKQTNKEQSQNSVEIQEKKEEDKKDNELVKEKNNEEINENKDKDKELDKDLDKDKNNIEEDPNLTENIDITKINSELKNEIIENKKEELEKEINKDNIQDEENKTKYGIKTNIDKEGIQFHLFSPKDVHKKINEKYNKKKYNTLIKDIYEKVLDYFDDNICKNFKLDLLIEIVSNGDLLLIQSFILKIANLIEDKNSEQKDFVEKELIDNNNLFHWLLETSFQIYILKNPDKESNKPFIPGFSLNIYKNSNNPLEQLETPYDDKEKKAIFNEIFKSSQKIINYILNNRIQKLDYLLTWSKYYLELKRENNLFNKVKDFINGFIMEALNGPNITTFSEQILLNNPKAKHTLYFISIFFEFYTYYKLEYNKKLFEKEEKIDIIKKLSYDFKYILFNQREKGIKINPIKELKEIETKIDDYVFIRVIFAIFLPIWNGNEKKSIKNENEIFTKYIEGNKGNKNTLITELEILFYSFNDGFLNNNDYCNKGIPLIIIIYHLFISFFNIGGTIKELNEYFTDFRALINLLTISSSTLNSSEMAKKKKWFKEEQYKNIQLTVESIFFNFLFYFYHRVKEFKKEIKEYNSKIKLEEQQKEQQETANNEYIEIKNNLECLTQLKQVYIQNLGYLLKILNKIYRSGKNEDTPIAMLKFIKKFLNYQTEGIKKSGAFLFIEKMYNECQSLNLNEANNNNNIINFRKSYYESSKKNPIDLINKNNENNKDESNDRQKKMKNRSLRIGHNTDINLRNYTTNPNSEDDPIKEKLLQTKTSDNLESNELNNFVAENSNISKDKEDVNISNSNIKANAKNININNEHNYLDDISQMVFTQKEVKEVIIVDDNFKKLEEYVDIFLEDKTVEKFYENHYEEHIKRLYPFISYMEKRQSEIEKIIPIYDNRKNISQYPINLCLVPYYYPENKYQNILSENIEKKNDNLNKEIKLAKKNNEIEEYFKCQHYRNIKKKLFKFNGMWSYQEYFYDYDKYRLKYKIINHMTNDFTKIFMSPITDIDYYLPKFSLFKGDIFRNNSESIIIPITKTTDLCLRLKEKIKNISDNKSNDKDNIKKTENKLEISANSHTSFDSLSNSSVSVSNISEIKQDSNSNLNVNIIKQNIPLYELNKENYPFLKEIETKENDTIPKDANANINFNEKDYNTFVNYIKRKHFIKNTDQCLLSEACLVKLAFHIRGIIYINNKEIGFYSYETKRVGNEDDYDSDKKVCYGSVFKGQSEKYSQYYLRIPFREIELIFKRRYYFKKNVLEIYNQEKKSYFFRIDENNFKPFLNLIKYHLKNDLEDITIDYSKYEEKIGFVNKNNILYNYNNYNILFNTKKSSSIKFLYGKWTRWEVSTFTLLNAMNIYSNRSYNDINQYPVFPWIITDYTSKVFPLLDGNLNTPTSNANPQTQNSSENNTPIIRPFNKPMGMMDITPDSKERKENYQEHWESLENDDDKDDNYDRYGSHYSTSLYLTYYLVRVFPFSYIRIELQGKKFDDPNRLFNSVSNSFECAMTQKSDLRELIPEFFCLPEMFYNLNDLNLGEITDEKTKENKLVNDIEMPPWSRSDAYIFIKKHRELLESVEISEKINEWFNIIFGSKQKGKAAKTIGNLFIRQTYEDFDDVHKNADPNEKTYQKRMVEFGVTPSQILKNDAIKRYGIRDLKKKPILFNFQIKTGKKEDVWNINEELEIKDSEVYLEGTPYKIFSSLKKNEDVKNEKILFLYQDKIKIISKTNEKGFFKKSKNKEKENKNVKINKDVKNKDNKHKEKNIKENEEKENKDAKEKEETKEALENKESKESNENEEANKPNNESDNEENNSEEEADIKDEVDSSKIRETISKYDKVLIIPKYRMNINEAPTIIYDKGNYIALGGFWNGHILINKLEESGNKKDKSQKNINIISTRSTYPITHMIIDFSETFVICTNKIGTIFIFIINQTNKKEWILSKIIQNNQKEISSIALNENLNIFVTCDKDGYNNLYTLPNCKLFNSYKFNESLFQNNNLTPTNKSFSRSTSNINITYGINNLYASHVIILHSPLPSLIFYIKSRKSLCVFSINFHFIKEVKLGYEIVPNGIKKYSDYFSKDYIFVYNKNDKTIDVYDLIDLNVNIIARSSKINYTFVDFHFSKEMDHALIMVKINEDKKNENVKAKNEERNYKILILNSPGRGDIKIF